MLSPLLEELSKLKLTDGSKDAILPSNDVEAFKDVLKSSRRIVCVSGAGLSAPSGIPTFRDSGGLWRKYSPLELSGKARFMDCPSRIWQFYHYRREIALRAHPNEGHYALAKFSLPHYREKIAPGSEFLHVTQNVDGLSKQALDSVASAKFCPIPYNPPSLIEMHGSLFDLLCTTYKCGYRWKDYNSPVVPALQGTEQIVALTDGMSEPDLKPEDLPRCPRCGALARPGVVWFGDIPHKIDYIMNMVRTVDLCLVVGTSSTVHPTAKIATAVKEAGGKVAVFNTARSKRDDEADFLFLGSSETLLPEALCLNELGG